MVDVRAALLVGSGRWALGDVLEDAPLTGLAASVRECGRECECGTDVCG